jgi:hypothetical protein
MALKILLSFAGEKGITNLQIFRDSLVIINWMRKFQRCHNIFLASLLEEGFLIIEIFTNLSFTHVYRERNRETYFLSKEGTSIAHGKWHILEFLDGQRHEHYHMPFIEQRVQRD